MRIILLRVKKMKCWCKRVEWVVVVMLVVVMCNDGVGVLGGPSDGFREVSLSQTNFELHKPYDKPTASRYTKSNGVETFWVFFDDKPFKQGSPTKPRTEIRISGNDYTSGVWQFEGNFYVPSGTNGACIMQVFGAANQATTLQLRVYDGNLRAYKSELVASNIYDKWFKLNVIHDVGNSRVTVFINDVQKAVLGGKGASTFYFKYGVYAQDGSSNRMESRWRGVKVYKK